MRSNVIDRIENENYNYNKYNVRRLTTFFAQNGKIWVPVYPG